MTTTGDDRPKLGSNAKAAVKEVREELRETVKDVRQGVRDAVQDTAKAVTSLGKKNEEKKTGTD